MNKFTIVYASTSGNVACEVDFVAQMLEKRGYAVNKVRAELAKATEVFSQEGKFILATSTWEHGRINPYFDRFLGEMKQLDLAGKEAAFIGLGDRRYEPVLFCKGIDILKEAFLTQGGTELSHTLRIDGEPQDVLQSQVAEWGHKLLLLASI